MFTQKFRGLFTDYIKERGEMNEDHFAALLYTFPSILVANADGEIDPREKDFMQFLPEVMADEEKDPSNLGDVKLSVDYFKEVDYLLKNLKKWESRFIDTLNDQLNFTGHEKNAIFRIMWRTADSSNDISEDERKIIDSLTERLGL